jgi:Mce-associated membrane protein
MGKRLTRQAVQAGVLGWGRWVFRTPARVVAALAMTTVVVSALAGAAWYDSAQAQRVSRAGQEALSTATSATQAIFSYDYRHFDASVTNGQQFVTGDFAKEYAETTASLKAAAEKEHAVVRAEVSTAAVVQAGADQVEVLLYVNQYRQNVNITGEKVDQNRVVLTLVPVDGQWKVLRASAI